uniref:U3 small nucleolar RNA-associated protein 15 homolog n=1 Tax=Plectus sambesii TaxID=2011161 RepID=A0A914XAE3_9BILA
MGTFKPTQIIDYKRSEDLLTDEDIYWRRLKTAAVIQEPGHVSCVDFSPKSPHYLAATSSVKVTLYDTSVCEPHALYSRFKQAVYGGRFRHDGTLLAAGGQEGRIRVFDVNSSTKAPLRTYKAHESATHFVKFVAKGQRVVSFGDDQSIKCWDLADMGAIPVVAFPGAHADHIRCGDVAHTSEHLLVSGSYDHMAKLWDCRTHEAVATVDHGWPVEAVLLFPNDSLLATAGGTVVKIWDLTAGGKQLAVLSHHHKTITSLTFAANHSRLLSGGLDKHVKVYDTATYEVVHSMDFPGAVLSVAISPDDNVLAVGMTGGNLLAIQRREPDKKVVNAVRKRQTARPTIVAHQVFTEGEYVKSDVPVTAARESAALTRFDQCLKAFQHSKALDCLLKTSYLVERKPEMIVSGLRELNRCGALAKALAGRDYSTLGPLLRFLCRHIGRQKFLRTLLVTADTLVDIYGGNSELDPHTEKLLKKLRDAVGREIGVQKQLCSVVGALDLLFQAAKPPAPPVSNEVFGEAVVEPIVFSKKSHGFDVFGATS